MSAEKEQAESLLAVEATMRRMGLLDAAIDVQLLEWTKSTSREGPKLRLLLTDDEDVVPFEMATTRKGKIAGQLYRAFFVRVDSLSPTPIEAREAPRPPNHFARLLHSRGYFRNPRLWAMLEERGLVDQGHRRTWCEGLPCIGPKLQVEGGRLATPCAGEVCAHHCRSADLPAASKLNPMKVAEWYTAPLCFHHHNGWMHASNGATREDHKRVQQMAISLTEEYIRDAIRAYLRIESFADATIEMMAEFEQAMEFNSGMLTSIAEALEA